MVTFIHWRIMIIFEAMKTVLYFSADYGKNNYILNFFVFTIEFIRIANQSPAKGRSVNCVTYF